MNSRQRVLTALNFEEPDRIPLDLGGNQTGITYKAYKRLLEYLGWEEEIEVMDVIQQLARPSERLLEYLGIDTRYLSANPPDNWRLEIFEEEINQRPHLSFTDEFGIKWSMPKEGGLYFDITLSPLAEATIKEIERYPFPDGKQEGRFRGLKEKAKALYETTDKAIVSGISGVVFEYGWYLMGFERFFACLAEEPKMVEAILDRTLGFWLDFEKAFLAEVGEYLQVICVGDDLAGQRGLLMSPNAYRSLIKPRQKKLYDLIHRRTKAKLWYHSCGAIREIIPDLIDIGVEIINPIQVSAAGMDTAELKAEFGKYLSFWGGGCDTQHILPFGTPEEVSAEVYRRISNLAKGGGYVFAPVHNIQPDVPAENILRMFQTARDWHYQLREV